MINDDIKLQIEQLQKHKIIYVDTEVATYKVNPRLSLIQLIPYTDSDIEIDELAKSAILFDVLDRPEITQEFIEKIMVNPNIEKVFHNANFDLRFLGGIEKCKNCTCTLKMSKQIPYFLLPVKNYKLVILMITLY